MSAMSFASVDMVQLLLENGADAYATDSGGMNSFMYSCTLNRVKNVEYWLQQYPDWDMEARNTLVGGTALGMAVTMGPNRSKLTQLLLEHGADILSQSHTGSSILMSACANKDCDIDLIRTVLRSLPNCSLVNLQRKSMTIRWKLIRLLANVFVRCARKSSGLPYWLAWTSGATAMHHAVFRGDIEIVELLLSEGANPSIRNDLGKSAVDMCTRFPELQRLLLKRIRKMEVRGGTLKRDNVSSCMHAALGKRISTATPINHDMWLISLETMLRLYGKFGHVTIMDVHQELKRRGFLTRWQDVPSDSEIIFVSHEWLSWAHPDPEGEQLKVLCRVLEKLRRGEIDTEMDPIHTILYKHKFKTKGKDWKAMLKRTYLWVDWFSMPQPGAEKEKEIGKEAMATLRAEGSRAIRSIPAYVERSDFIMILVPGCRHSDRKVPTCYRTWRRRGWCLLELYAAAMARDSSNPPLLVRSERGRPMWVSPLEILKLSIGMADFTCCQRNHVITTETQKIMSGESVKKISCDKPIAGGILEHLIDAKINHLFNAEKSYVMARLHYVLKHWWMRGLNHHSSKSNVVVVSTINTLKKNLKWSHKNEWFDRDNISLLTYAVIIDDEYITREILDYAKRTCNHDKYNQILESRIRNQGYPRLGIPGGSTALMAAMMCASPEIVSMLIESGANVESVDIMGNDALMFASIAGRTKNILYWCDNIKDWNVNRQSKFGGYALGCALYVCVCVSSEARRTSVCVCAV